MSNPVTPTENKVQFSLCNVYYAVYNTTTGTYGTPVRIPGAVNLNLSPTGEMQKFYADGVEYWIGAANGGYSGSVEFALIPPAMLKDVWGFTEDADHVLIEKISDTVKPFALLYQVDGDQRKEYYAMYNMTAQRPPLSAATNESSKSIATCSLDVECTANNAGCVKASTQATVSDTVRAGWFTSVHTPTSESAGGGAGGDT